MSTRIANIFCVRVRVLISLFIIFCHQVYVPIFPNPLMIHVSNTYYLKKIFESRDFENNIHFRIKRMKI